MFFIASKLVWFILTPSNALVALVIAGTVLVFSRFRKAGRAMLLTGALGLLLAGLSPLPNMLMLALESRFPVPDLDALGAVDGIIVLGGATTAPVATARGVVALNEAAERLAVVPGLARRLPAIPIILSGGSGQLILETDPEAIEMGDLLISMGVDPDRMVLETDSRNTAENATETLRRIEPRSGSRYLLITSGFHMPRAVGAFRQAGWTGIVPYPVDFRTRGAVDVLRPMVSIGSGLKRTDTAVREYIGLVAYWLSGRTDSLFPGP